MAQINQVEVGNTTYGIQAIAIPYGELDSTSTATVMTVTVPGINELKNGVVCYVRNNVITSASGFTLDVNGLGAKPVYSTLAAASRSTTIFNVNYTMMFIYNENRVEGGCWDIFYGYDSNTNTIGYQIRTYAQTMAMTDKMYRYRLMFTSADGKHYVPANSSTSTNGTAKRDVITTPIDPFGAIFYYGYTTAIDAGSRPSASYFWQQYSGVTLGYSFNRTNAALTLTSYEPIYVKCTPQSNGSAIIDPDQPYVQTLPNTEDGYIYIFIGIATSATAFELMLNHPIYYYKNNAIRIWTNPV